MYTVPYIIYMYIYKSDTFTIQSVPSHHHLQWSFFKTHLPHLQGTAAQGLVLAARLAARYETHAWWKEGQAPPHLSWKKWVCDAEYDWNSKQTTS